MLNNASTSNTDTSASEQERKQSLEAAFRFFSETSTQLENSYSSLQKKVQLLSAELDQSKKKRKQQHQIHHRLEERMQALLHCLPGGVLVLDERGVVVDANPAAEKLLERPLVGEVWRYLIAHCFCPQNDDGLEVSTRSGRRLSILTSSLLDQGQIILLTDQTETRRLQQHVSRSERLSAMGKMVSALAHQIRTPLSAALLYAGHLTDESLDSDLRLRFSEKCVSRLKHMEKQVRDMMLFVKSELPLNDVITVAKLEFELKNAAEHIFTDGRIQVQWQNQCATQLVKCHTDALVSALMNLINNAVQSMHLQNDAQLIIRFKQACVSAEDHTDKHDFLVIEVIDNGPGMDSVLLEQVQQIFTTTKAQGTGLGLAVVKSVSRAHGGEFQIDSVNQEGCQARVFIPLVSQLNQQ